MDKNSSKIIVIGAGAAGIAAATRLLENGFDNVRILEAENRIGGRICSEELHGRIVDLGAQWCHGEKDNIVYKYAKDLELLEPSVNSYNDFTYYDTSGEVLNKEITDELVSVGCKIRDENEMAEYEGSFGEYFIQRYKDILLLAEENETYHNYSEFLMDWFHKMFICLDAAETWFQVSARSFSQYKECEGNLYLNWKNGGYKTILQVLMDNLTSLERKYQIENKILLNKKVCQILWKDDSSKNEQVIIKCLDGSQYTANQVIITTSLGVLKNCHKNLFIPQLPKTKRDVIEGLGFGTVDKIMIEFTSQWWSESCNGFSFIWSKNDDEAISSLSLETDYDMSWIKSISGFYPINNGPILVAFVVGPSVHTFENVPKKIILRGCTFVLEKFLKNSFEITDPVDLLHSTWSTNPHFYGSYTYLSTESDRMNVTTKDLASPILVNNKPCLLFAGEATHPCYFSTVHGAIETGFREANRIIEYFNHLSCKIVIVGAGMAGLGAAKYLIEQNCDDIVVLEAQNQPGGRVKSVVFEKNIYELGAQWIHGSRSLLYSLAKQHALISSQTSNEGIGLFVRDDGFVFDDFLVKRVDLEIGKILERCEKLIYNAVQPSSVGNFLEEQFMQYLEEMNDDANEKELKLQLFDWHVKFQTIDNSCSSLKDLSINDWGKYVCEETDDRQHTNLSCGYRSIIDTLIKLLPEEIFKYNFAVSKIIWNGARKIKLFTRNGFKINCEHVIITSSLGYLKTHSSTFFEPDLPDSITRVINSIGFYGVGKVFLIFKYKWWVIEGFQLIWKTTTKLTGANKWLHYVSGFDAVFNQPTSLIAWVGGDGVAIMESLSEDTIGKHCVELLKTFLKRDDIPNPIKVLKSGWLSNPWIKGGYSYSTTQCDKYGINFSNLSEPILKNGVPRILFAGEACHATNFSTTHGAFQSGQDQAKLLWDFISYNKNCSIKN